MINNKLFGFDPDALGLVRGSYQGKHEIHVCCPFHGGHGKSASFNIHTGKFYCFKCGAKANAYEIANQFGGQVVQREIKTKEDDEDEWRIFLQAPIDITNEYLLNRGVTSEQIEAHEIRSLDDGIFIPQKNQSGEVVGAVIRKYKGSFRYLTCGHKIEGWPLNKMSSYDRRQPLIVVEGIFGALRGEKYGHNTIASLGAMVKNNLVDKWLTQFRVVIVTFDPDDGGYKGGLRILKRLPTAQITIPGFAVDEADDEMWDYIVSKANKTSNPLVLEKFLGEDMWKEQRV